jgi:hypothetical protein
MENFAEIEREFSAAGALVKISGADELAGAVEALLTDDAGEGDRRARSRAAMTKRGVVDKVAAVVLEAAGQGVSSPFRTLAARAALRPLSWLWAVGNRIDLKRGLAAARSLDTPVVSIGGLTMGGAGKSPLVAHLPLAWPMRVAIQRS